MKNQWVDYLCDPVDKTSLVIDEVFKKSGDRIITGTIKSESGNFYSIEGGIPRLINHQTQQVDTVESFAYEWKKFDFSYGKKGWIQDIVKPSVGNLNFFKNKVIVDCGAGSGRQSLWMVKAGAKFIFAIELSNSVTMIKKLTGKFSDKVFVIQADIAHFPIKKTAGIDLIYCVNMIQHTKNPVKTLKELSEIISIDSIVIFNIYLIAGKGMILKIISLVRKITRFLPSLILRMLSFFLAILLHFLDLLPLVIKNLTVQRLISRSFKETWLDIYDLIGHHTYQKFYSDKELLSILKTSSLEIVKRSRYSMILRKF